MLSVDRLRRLFRYFAATQCPGRSRVYQALADGIAADDGLLGLLADTPDDQARPSLLLAAVNLLLAADTAAPLAAYYPIHGGDRPVDDGLLPAFAAFTAAHRDELAVLLRERSTQTNEIRRCLALRLGLDRVHRHWPGPLALVEIGASAGLNLRFDRYAYALDGADPADPATITVDADPPLPGLVVPELSTRLGVDRDPVDLTDPAARDWLAAFVWPEQTRDRALLRAAVAPARTDPPPVVRGDATTDTARIIGELPGREPVVVFTASLLSYLDADGRAAFLGQLRAAAGHRPVAWVFAESPALVASCGIAVDAGLARRNGLYLIGTTVPGPELLALADPYLRRLAPARHPADDFGWAELRPGA